MSELKWTPGPWTIGSEDDPRDIFCDDPQTELLATAYPMGGRECEDGDGPVGRANAHLMAAAPELYDALLAMTSPGDQATNYQKARAALAKARGEA